MEERPYDVDCSNRDNMNATLSHIHEEIKQSTIHARDVVFHFSWKLRAAEVFNGEVIAVLTSGEWPCISLDRGNTPTFY